MSGKTKIEWATDQWNPTTGCTKVSQGCKRCYAEREWPRLAAPRQNPNIYTGRAFTDVRCHPEKLAVPLRWTKPRRIFVNSMSDLFHEDVPDDFIDKVFAIMALAIRHTFLVLTKRPKRMRVYLSDGSLYDRLLRAACTIRAEWPGRHALHRISISDPTRSPFRNVWLGVSVEDQAAADERIPLLLQTPAAVRWVSAEPLLSEIDLRQIDLGAMYWLNALTGNVRISHDGGMPAAPQHERLDWVICGGESGPQARPFVLGWGKDIVRQCRAAGIPVFVKQVGSCPTNREGEPCQHITDRKGGDPSEWPEDLWVREYPTAQ